MDNIGHIKIHRSVRRHWIWDDAVKYKWWSDMVMEVNWKDAKVLIGMMLIDCKRGQCIRRLQGWATRWGVSKNRVKRFFDLLKKDQMIDTENINKTTRITICNYDHYQDNPNDNELDNESDDGTIVNPIVDTNRRSKEEEEYKEVKNNISKDIYVGFIKSFNEIKGSKYKATEKVKKQFNARMKEGFTVDQMLAALKNAMQSEYHIKNNLRFLTPEFFTRSDKIELYCNDSGEKNKKSQEQIYY